MIAVKKLRAHTARAGAVAQDRSVRCARPNITMAVDDLSRRRNASVIRRLSGWHSGTRIHCSYWRPKSTGPSPPLRVCAERVNDVIAVKNLRTHTARARAVAQDRSVSCLSPNIAIAVDDLTCRRNASVIRRLQSRRRCRRRGWGRCWSGARIHRSCRGPKSTSPSPPLRVCAERVNDVIAEENLRTYAARACAVAQDCSVS